MNDDNLKIVSNSELQQLTEGYRNLLPLNSQLEDRLGGVLADILQRPGGLTRSKLSWKILNLYGMAENEALSIATAIEYFHTASLLFDDLPCMDNSQIRRGHICSHLKFGVAPTILGALALINKAYVLIYSVTGKLSPEINRRVTDILDNCLGVEGILDGQSRDLNFDEALPDNENITKAVMGKTVTLIRLALTLPVIIHGGDRRTLIHLNRLAAFWGLAYQIIDDFKDLYMTTEETGKTTANDLVSARPNLPLNLGVTDAYERLSRLLRLSGETVRRLVLTDKKWDFLFKMQKFWEEEVFSCQYQKVA